MPKCVVFYLEGPPAGADLIIDSVTIARSEHKQLKVSAFLCAFVLPIPEQHVLHFI